MAKYNTQLIRLVYDKIQQEPEAHSQIIWGKVSLGTIKDDESEWCHTAGWKLFVKFDPVKHICKTTACVAGWACIFDDPSSLMVERDTKEIVCGEEGFSQKAMKAMGISAPLSTYLFCYSRTYSEVLWLLYQLLEGKEEESIITEFQQNFLCGN